jgi:hypothetical protein
VVGRRPIGVSGFQIAVELAEPSADGGRHNWMARRGNRVMRLTHGRWLASALAASVVMVGCAAQTGPSATRSAVSRNLPPVVSYPSLTGIPSPAVLHGFNVIYVQVSPADYGGVTFAPAGDGLVVAITKGPHRASVEALVKSFKESGLLVQTIEVDRSFAELTRFRDIGVWRGGSAAVLLHIRSASIDVVSNKVILGLDNTADVPLLQLLEATYGDEIEVAKDLGARVAPAYGRAKLLFN